MTEKYEISVNQTKKEINMVIRGSFSKDDVMNFVKDYNQSLASIAPSEFVLNIDCTTMEVLTQEMIPDLENSLALYRQANFKKINIIIFNSSVIKMQISRVARHAKLDNYEITIK